MVRGQSVDSHLNNIPHKKMKIGSVFYDQSKMSKPIEEILGVPILTCA